jgi:energy-converting hydrogenase Eha subunit A
VGYLVRVKNRLLAATVVYYPFFDNEGPRQQVVRSLIYTLPIVGLVVVVVTRRWARDHLALIAIVIFVIYLTPYVLVAYYRRYAVPLAGLQAMFEIWGLDSIRAFVIHRRREDDEQLSTGVADEIRHR